MVNVGTGGVWAKTGAELRTAVFDYIEIFYNATRRHSTLGMLSPEQYEMITPTRQFQD